MAVNERRRFIFNEYSFILFLIFSCMMKTVFLYL